MKKWLRILTIILIILVFASMTATIVLNDKYASYEGKIEGTGFVIQELSGSGVSRVGGGRYDVDDYGNIYFAVTTPVEGGIVIYNNQGIYKYTLPFRSHGAMGVKIDNENNILVCDVRDDSITYYNSKGYYIYTENDIEYSREDEFFRSDFDNVRERNGVRYINRGCTIYKEENGTETMVFRVPVWQRWNSTSSLILILSIVALFLRIFIPQWKKAYKERYSK